MPTINQNIAFMQGNSKTLIFGPIVDNAGVPIDCRGATAQWWVGRTVGAIGADVFLAKSTGRRATAKEEIAGDTFLDVVCDLRKQNEDWWRAAEKKIGDPKLTSRPRALRN